MFAPVTDLPGTCMRLYGLSPNAEFPPSFKTGIRELCTTTNMMTAQQQNACTDICVAEYLNFLIYILPLTAVAFQWHSYNIYASLDVKCHL